MKVYIGPYIKPEEGKEREVEVEIHDYDLWSLDHTLAKIIYPALLKFREKDYGYPDVEDGDGPDEETLVSKYNSEIKGLWTPWEDDLSKNIEDEPKAKLLYMRWLWVLDQIIFSFHCMYTDNQWEMEFYDRKASPEEYIAMEERISNGLKLFGKYYRSLWN
jgi:hypothetical protein